MSKNRQLDLFVALIGDVPFRDEREAMSAPLVALSKNKRTRIEWEGPSGQRVLVTAPEEYGLMPAPKCSASSYCMQAMSSRRPTEVTPDDEAQKKLLACWFAGLHLSVPSKIGLSKQRLVGVSQLN